MDNRKFKLSTIYIWFVFILLYLPIFYLIFYSFNAGGTMNGFTEFTWEHYQTLFADSRLMSFLMNTLIIALLSAFIATLIGTFGAMAIYSNRSKKQRAGLLNLNNVLMVTPDVMMGASFLILFSMIVPNQFGFWTVLFSHVAFSIPIVVLMILPRLYEMNRNMVMAAKDLGANDLQILSRIMIPSIWPGIISGFFMAFTYSLDDFAVTFFVTGNGFSTLAVEIYSRARMGVSLEINALSTLMFIMALLLVLGYYYIQVGETRRKARKFRAEKAVL